MELQHYLAPHILDRLDAGQKTRLQKHYDEMRTATTDRRIKCENEIRSCLVQWLGPLD